MSDSSTSTVIIGIDGGDFGIAGDWIREGRLPVLARLMAEGSAAELRSTIIPFTPVAWSSFITGCNPGQHGIFDFVDWSSKRLSINNSSHRAVPSVWRLLNMGGREVGAVGIPMTFPPEEVDGFMVSGFGGIPVNHIAAYPASLVDEIRDFWPDFSNIYFPSLEELQEDLQACVERLRLDVRKRTKVAEMLMRRYPWDVFAAGFMAVDSAQHLLLHINNPTHPRYNPEVSAAFKDALYSVYLEVDTAIGHLLDVAAEISGSDLQTIIVSDHGATPVRRVFLPNVWLLENGWLVYRNKTTRQFLQRMTRAIKIDGSQLVQGAVRKLEAGLHRLLPSVERGIERVLRLLPGSFFEKSAERSYDEIDWERTQAVAVGNFGQLKLPATDRLSSQSSNDQAVVRLRQDVWKALGGLIDPQFGQNVVSDMWWREDIYQGKQVESAPDILFLPADGYLIDTGFVDQEAMFEDITTLDRYTGSHRMQGMLILHGSAFKTVSNLGQANIEDVAPTLLHVMGLPVPDFMDGEVLVGTLLDDQTPVKYIQMDIAVAAVAEDYSPEEEQEILDHLKDLGYL